MKRFQNMLVSVDTRSEIHPALQWSCSLAERNQAKVKIMDVLPASPWYSPESVERDRARLLAEKGERLESLAAPLRARGIEVSTQTAYGKTSVELTREVLRGHHDLVVRVSKGTHSRRRGFFGSTSFALMRQCPCPVWIVRPTGEPRFKHVLGAIDPMDQGACCETLNGDIIELTRSIAESENGRFSLVHAWTQYGVRALLAQTPQSQLDAERLRLRAVFAESLETQLAPHGLSVQDDNVHLINGEPAAAILKFAQAHDVDMIVLGTVARAGLSGFVMGNTAELILSWGELPVLALKPPGFVSAVQPA